MSAPRPVQAPAPYPYSGRFVTFISGWRGGKTHAMQQALRQLGQAAGQAATAMSGFRATLLSVDEFHLFPKIVVPPRDRTHFERGGRYRKPPIATKVTRPAPGMVRMRDRTGALVWRKVGDGGENRRMREQSSWGAFG